MKLFHPGLALLASVMLSAGVEAAVVTDGTMGAATRLSGPDYNVSSTLGQSRGSNLFHSFSNFSIVKGESVTFGGPASITNIISRVTGGEVSSIDGRISSTIAGANLYLVNPSGIMFGPNATLDVSGSFHATTADYLKLGEAGRFDATTPSNTVLTVDPPSAFGFLGPNPAPIIVTDSSLSVPETLTLVGGDITISNETKKSEKTISAGGLNLISVGSAGEATVAETAIATSTFSRMGTALLLRNPDLDRQSPRGTYDSDLSTSGGRVFISAGSFIVNGSRLTSSTPLGIDRDSGDISITARDGVSISGGGRVLSATYGAGNAGAITVTSPAFVVDDALVYADSFGAGNGGDIAVKSNAVTVTNGGWISTESRGSGVGGTLSIQSATVRVDGGKVTADAGDRGTGGNVNITAGDITVQHGTISSSTDGRGNAGNVSIDASGRLLISAGNVSTGTSDDSPGGGGNLTISGGAAVTLFNSNVSSGGKHYKDQPQTRNRDSGTIAVSSGAAVTLRNSSISSEATGTGDGGNIQISTPTLSMGGGTIDSRAYGRGDSGTISVSSDNMSMLNGGYITSDNHSGRGTSHKRGDISIAATHSLTISSGSRISSATFGARHAGKIGVKTPSLLIEGENSSLYSDSFSASTAGDITVEADAVTVRNGGEIASYSNSTGNSGNISIKTRTLTVQQGRKVGAISNSCFWKVGEKEPGDAGDITIEATDKVMISDSLISTAPGPNSTRNGGNITITGGAAVIVENNSKISSEASGRGTGGDINISARTLTVDGSKIVSDTHRTFSSGAISVKADDVIITNSGMIGASTTDQGNGNSISVIARSLSVTDGGSISATSSSTGEAGTITLNVGNRFLMDGGTITTEAANATGGNITIDPLFAHLTDSSISTSVNGGKGNGGNITMAADTFLLQRSNLMANAIGGNGGSVGITANLYVADAESALTASSQLGLPGTVDINAPLVDLSGTLISLPEGLLKDDLGPRTCQANDDSLSSFTVGGSPLQYRPERDLLAL